MDIACLIIGACLVTGRIKKQLSFGCLPDGHSLLDHRSLLGHRVDLNNSPLGACLMDIACLIIGACLVTGVI